LKPSRLEVGVIVRAHGIRGELRVRPHWSDSRSLDGAKALWLALPGKPDGVYTVESCRRADKDVLVRLKGIADRDQAEALRGARISLERSELEPLADGEYFLSDLVGARVIGPDGIVGEVKAVRAHPSVDTLIISTPDGRELEQPLVPAWVESVSVEQGVIELSSTDGLI
jgi:16S rRNA processing protein RimM